jgi:hypothetical protein
VSPAFLRDEAERVAEASRQAAEKVERAAALLVEAAHAAGLPDDRAKQVLRLLEMTRREARALRDDERSAATMADIHARAA